MAPAETVHPLRVCTVSAGQITSTITPAAIWPLCFFLPVLSIPFRRLCRPFLNGRGKGKDRKGMEWIIDKSLLDFIFSYLYLYFIALDFPTSVFPLSDYPTTEMPTTAKRARHHLFVPCPLSSISYRGECYRPNFKSSKQVVHLRGYLLKVQIYQPFSRAGCVLPWQTNKIFVISWNLLNLLIFRALQVFCGNLLLILRYNPGAVRTLVFACAGAFFHKKGFDMML